MKTLVVYDSQFGNTERVARTLGSALGEEASVVQVDGVDADRLNEYELVIVGSPTQGGRPTPLTKAFLNRIPGGGLKGVNVTGFDTRIDSQTQGFVLRVFMGLLGYAAGRIARKLESKGGTLITQPRGFLVEGKEGPLSDGELERAGAWAFSIANTPVA
jgi:flavodoxin